MSSSMANLECQEKRKKIFDQKTSLIIYIYIYTLPTTKLEPKAIPLEKEIHHCKYKSSISGWYTATAALKFAGQSLGPTYYLFVFIPNDLRDGGW